MSSKDIDQIETTNEFNFENKFSFLHVSSCFPRKGIECLLSAYFQLFRDANAGGDTFTADARVLGVKLFFTTDAANDA